MPIALFAATALCALFAFGLIQTAFAQPALALFYVFGAVLLLTLAMRPFLRPRTIGEGGRSTNNHGLLFSVRVVGAIMVVSAFAALFLFWTDADPNGQRVGRALGEITHGMSRQVEATQAALNESPAEEETAQN